MIEQPTNRIYVYREDKQRGAGPREILYLDYSDIEFVKKVISLIADDPEMIVANEHGTVWFGDLFVAYLKAHPEWNWRNDVP